MLFDFNFDFILCLSFLFLFLIHFFIKLIFSILVNYIIFNTLLCITNLIYILFTFITFISFYFISSILYCLKSLELYFNVTTICLVDFLHFSEINSIHENSNIHVNIVNTFYILFYFILHILNFTTILMIRFFFAISYCILSTTDINTNIKDIEVKNIYGNIALVINNNSTNIYTQKPVYTYLLLIKINIILMNTLIQIFYTYKNMIFFQKKNVDTLYFQKITKHLHKLNICYTLTISKNNFSHISVLMLINYIIFTINFFGLIVKDFTHINITINNFTLLLVYYINNFNFNINIKIKNSLQLKYNSYN